MAKSSKQATADGRLETGYDPEHPKMAERQKVLVDGFEARGWKTKIITTDENRRLTVLDASMGGHHYKINAFVFPNLAYASRHEEEKRIQLSREYSEHKREFQLPNTGEERCLLLGMYSREGKTIVAAWDAAAYREHANPSSCYVRVPAIADAMRTGFGQSVDGKGRLVCCFQPDLLPFYVENIRHLHDHILIDKETIDGSRDESADDVGVESEQDIDIEPNAVPPDLVRNRIIYGAPGTGKSYRLESDVKQFFGKNELHERITFHPDYTYGQLVGAYRPVPVYKSGAEQLVAADKTTAAGVLEPIIDYAYVAGPFLRLLIRAIKNPAHNFVLIIEELNRANAPAVFGEVFQLLDRDDNGEGKFTVALPAEAQDFLRSKGLNKSIRLPKNLYLWATMNSADQGVMPLDAAFKRRWSFEYMPLNEFEAVTAGWQVDLKFLGKTIPWNSFRSTINNHLRTLEIPEDRLIGPFFMREDELKSPHAFKNKLLLYLREDVVRHNPEVLFRGSSNGYGAIVESYDRGEPIFVEGIKFIGS